MGDVARVLSLTGGVLIGFSLVACGLAAVVWLVNR